MRRENFIYRPRKVIWARRLLAASMLLVLLAAAVLGFSHITYIKNVLPIRIQYAWIYMKSVFEPVGAMPTSVHSDSPVAAEVATATPTPTNPLPTTTATPTPELSPTPTLTPTPLPAQVNLPSPKNEKEDWNACGPATLAMYLRTYGWQGDQFTISNVIKPIREDRNVNIEELVYYINTKEPWIAAQYRVGGTLDILKRLMAAGYPVMIEGSFRLDQEFWVGDDRWAGHYLLLTGYNDAGGYVITQDSERGADQHVSYAQLAIDWQSFNHVFLLLYPPEQQATIQNLLGADWDIDANRQRALDDARAETEANPKNGFAWFNLGTNLTYFSRYGEAVKAYDKAREAGLPQRMLRYQFGPFMAYFNTGRYDDLLELTEYSLKRTSNSEEALLWRGWAMYRLNRRAEAEEMFKKALEARPGYPDAEYALNFLYTN